jgi:hypothetical protein
MNNKIFVTVIIIIGFVSSTFPQQTFRRAAYLSQSVGTHIYDHSQVGSPGTTTVPNEVAIYNTANGYTSDNPFTIYNPTDDYPPAGNQMWKWKAAFYDEMNTALIPPQPYNFKEDYLDTDTYDIIMVKFCAASQSGIWYWWYEGPQDTLNYPFTQSTYNYQWYMRKIVRKMEEYPNKFFFLWNIPSATEQESSPADMQRLADFNKWMTDTLQAGLDSYGAFPPNVKIFDFFNLLKSPNSNYMDPIYRDSPTDYHPNALASSVVAPVLVQRMFDAAIAYEGIVPVELTSFTGDYNDGVVNLKWITSTETNNHGFEVERRTDYSAFESIGFVTGNGTSTNRVTYNFIDDNLSSNRYYYRLKQIDLDGTFEYSYEVQIDIDALMNYQLYQNYPNPFNPSTEIYFTLAKSGNVSLKVFNSLGSVVATLIDGFMETGKHSIKYNSKDSSSGIYFYRLKADNFTSTRKMLLIK